MLTWEGSAAAKPRDWDVKTTANWDNAGSPDVFWSSDAVRFDGTATTNVVNLVGTLGPAYISMENSGGSYTFGGSGGLVASSLTNAGGDLTLTNTANTFFTGVGLVLDAGSVTFAQPTNASLAANLNGSGTFNKAGNSILTLVGNAGNFFGTANVTGGTLRAGSSNAVASTVNVASTGTLDVNGQLLPFANVSVTGAGADGWGAINNKGLGRTNSLANVTLAGPATFGALSNAWGISGTLVGGGFALTKTNANDVWIQTGSDTDLGDIDVRQGRLVFGQEGTTLGRAANAVVIRPGATLALAATNAMPQSGLGVTGIAAGDKPLILTNSTLESIGFSVNQTTVNSHSGPITVATNAHFKVGGNSRLILSGPISGPSQVILTNGGTLYLGGTNTYSSNTFVFSGTLVLSNALSLPTNTVLAISNNISTFGNPSLEFAENPVFQTTNLLRLSAHNSSLSIGGNGTWNGPIHLHGSNNLNIINFQGGTELLDLAGPLITTNVGAAAIAFHGSNTRIRGALLTPLATVGIGVGDGLGGTMQNFTTVTFEKSNIWSGTTTIDRGRVNIRANNALPPSVPIRVGTLAAGVADRRITFDLGGYNQTISTITETAVGDSVVRIGNSSTNADSILTVSAPASATNTWAIELVNDLDNQLDHTNTLGLTLASGTLVLLNTSTYTGPTLVTGGSLMLNIGSGFTAGRIGQLGNTPVTVSGTGTLGGNGSIAGPVTIAAGGTLSAGASIGSLTINNSLQLQAGSRSLFEVHLGAATNDLVAGISTLSFGGTLVITNVGALPLANGNAFKLFDAASYVAGSVSIQPASPGPGLAWDASQLAVDGTLRITTLPPAPAIASYGRLGDGNFGITVNGVDGRLYSLLASTNVAAPLNTWTVIQSGTQVGSSINFVDLGATNNPIRFYLISAP